MGCVKRVRALRLFSLSVISSVSVSVRATRRARGVGAIDDDLIHAFEWVCPLFLGH
jgi:hypothetical protein